MLNKTTFFPLKLLFYCKEDSAGLRNMTVQDAGFDGRRYGTADLHVVGTISIDGMRELVAALASRAQVPGDIPY